jgi:hypothetical protein
MRQETKGWARTAWLAGLLAALAAGCSGEPAGAPVKGKVILANGKPLTTGTVIFHPDADRGNKTPHEARGAIDEFGQYTLTSDGARQQGVPPGWYKVSVVATKKDPRNEYAVPTWLIPQRYGKPQTSGLEREVKEDAAAGAYDLKLAP